VDQPQVTCLWLATVPGRVIVVQQNPAASYIYTNHRAPLLRAHVQPLNQRHFLLIQSLVEVNVVSWLVMQVPFLHFDLSRLAGDMDVARVRSQAFAGALGQTTIRRLVCQNLPQKRRSRAPTGSWQDRWEEEESNMQMFAIAADCIGYLLRISMF
jgi:hypothetical protein